MFPENKASYVDSDEAKDLLNSIEDQLSRRFEEIRDDKYNPNTKGYDYEEIAKIFLENYLGGAFDFSQRFGVLDIELKANSIFDPRENEFDILALYKNAVPKLVYGRFIPYDSVAFIVEVKQTLKLDNLEKDLLKFSKLNELIVGTRFLLPRPYETYSPLKIDRPVRILLYYEASIDKDKGFNLLNEKYSDSWDILLIVKEGEVYLNTTLPLVTTAFKSTEFTWGKIPLLIMMFTTCISIHGDFVNSWGIFWNLLRSEAHGNK